MKTLTQLFMLGVAIILITTSCGNNNTDSSSFEIKNPSQVRAGALVDEAKSSDLILNFNGQDITISTTDIIGAAQKMNAENQDAIDVMNINQTLMGAEKEAQVLDVNFTMSDKPVENGMFIFGIETPDSKNLTLEMYDEEGFALVANNKFDINFITDDEITIRGKVLRYYHEACKIYPNRNAFKGIVDWFITQKQIPNNDGSDAYYQKRAFDLFYS